MGVGNGFGGQLFNVAASTVTSRFLTNSVNVAQGIQGASLFDGFTGDLFRLPDAASGVTPGIGFSLGVNISAFVGSAILAANDNDLLPREIAA